MQNVKEFINDLGQIICSEYCKYPDQYGVDMDDKGSDDQFCKMMKEKCANCPLN